MTARRSLPLRQALSIAAIAAGFLGANTAKAAACADGPGAPVFERWGDHSAHLVVPGGTFEAGIGWETEGEVARVPETDPYEVGGASAKSLRLGPSATVASPQFCIGAHEPTLRMVVQAAKPDGKLKLTAEWTKKDGKGKQKKVAKLDSSDFEHATLLEPIDLKAAKPKQGSRNVSLRISADDSADWTIDDVHFANPETPACDDVDSQLIFTSFDDPHYYSLVQGGSFEDSLSWSATGSPQLVDEGNPFDLGGTESTRAARLQAGDSIVSPPLCVDRRYPHLRFVAKSIAADADLKIAALWTDDKGKQKESDLGNHKDEHDGWHVSKHVKLKKVLPKEDEARDIRLRFTVKKGSGSWLVDDVYVDPYKRN